jgi:hypothetical protein
LLPPPPLNVVTVPAARFKTAFAPLIVQELTWLLAPPSKIVPVPLA